MATRFRQLGPEDAELLAHHLVVWHREAAATVDPAEARRETRRILTDNEGWHVWLIEQGELAAGYLVLNFRKSSRSEAPRAYVAALYVTPALRHLPLGRSARRLVADLGRWLGVRVFAFDTEGEDKHLHLPTRTASPLALRHHPTPMLQATA